MKIKTRTHSSMSGAWAPGGGLPACSTLLSFRFSVQNFPGLAIGGFFGYSRPDLGILSSDCLGLSVIPGADCHESRGSARQSRQEAWLSCTPAVATQCACFTGFAPARLIVLSVPDRFLGYHGKDGKRPGPQGGSHQLELRVVAGCSLGPPGGNPLRTSPRAVRWFSKDGAPAPRAAAAEHTS